MMFRSLRHYNLRLFLGGQLVSVLGGWMQMVASSWLVYRLTGSAALLGVFVFAMNVPALVIAPLAGLAADRVDRCRLLVAVNILSMCQAVVLWALAVTGTVQVWHLMVLTVLQGIFNAFEFPVRQASISRMIDDPRDLPNALALNSSVFNGSRLIGPAVAGVVIAMFGEGVCFLINAISFLPVIVALCLMRLPAAGNDLADATGGGFMEGLRYVRGSMPIRTLLLMVAVVSMQNGVFYALAPVFARDVFGGGPRTLGFLLSASGVGALAAAMYLAGRKTVIGLGRITAVAAAGSALALMAFALTRDVRLAAVAVLFNGLCMIVSIGGMNMIIQTLVEEQKRGRVMSLYTMALIGLSPFGSLAAGAMAAKTGGPVVILGAAAVVVAASAAFWRSLPSFRLAVRPIYAAKGIIPEA